jgi:hypothetical protein
MTGSVAPCRQCGSNTYVEPLHGERGGPPYCPICAGAWHAEHGRKRRAARVVIKALRGYDEAAGSLYGKDFDVLKLAAGSLPIYDADARAAPDGFRDLTTELLAATLALVHPDKHPPEMKAEANRITQELLALKPFVFPAREPEKPIPPTPKTEKADLDLDLSGVGDVVKKGFYLCEDCRDAVPYEYCNACRAEWEKREREESEKQAAIQRAEYKRRREWELAARELRKCKTCGIKFKRPRTDALYCSDTCRQRAHRKRRALVTDNTRLPPATSSSRDMCLEKRVLEILQKQPAVFLNDILPRDRTRSQYQALCLASVKLEREGKIESSRYLVRWGKPGYVVLHRPGYEIADHDEIPRLQKWHPF